MHAHDTSDLLRRLLGAPSRNHFFYGKRMDVQHFQMEQDYGKHKQWLLNRLTLGKGVLCGLQVSQDGERVCVDPGVAIDGLGREIVVPVRACIDPAAPQCGCCPEPGTTPAPEPAPAHDAASHTLAATEGVRGAATADKDGVFTVWLCYHECFTDQQPVLVTDCDTRRHCAPGTVVESFCLKVTPGLPPLQRDPDWCLNWAAGKDKPAEPAKEEPAPVKAGTKANMQQIQQMQHGAGLETLTPPHVLKDRDLGRRHALCELLDQACDAERGDPCVPIAAGMVRDGRIVRLESCAVRPRIYSNAVLLDLILCLAERVDACCNGEVPPAPQPPAPQPEPKTLLRVAGVTFLSRARDGSETVVAEVKSPLDPIKLKFKQQPNAIRVRFTADVLQAAPNLPSTHVYGDPKPDSHNVQVRPETVVGNADYVPGELTIEDKRTVRFDLFPDSPYVHHENGAMGWKKGAFTLLLFGDDEPAADRFAIADTGHVGLDGEAAAPANGAISGDGSPGGTFKLGFIIN